MATKSREPATTSLKREFDYYLSHQAQLVGEFNGKYIVIRDGKVVGAYDDDLEAVTETKKTYPLGTFLVQKVSPGSADYTATYHSRVRFQ